MGPGSHHWGNFDAGLHAAVAQNSLEYDRAEDFANDPGCPMIRAALGRAQPFADVLDDLGEIPIAGSGIARTVQVIDVGQDVLPVLEIELAPVQRGL